MKEWINELGIREYRKKIDNDYRRKCEDKIFELKDRFNCLSIEIGKITQEAKELRESKARVQSRKIIIDDDDDNLGFYAFIPITISIPVRKTSVHNNLLNLAHFLQKSDERSPDLLSFSDNSITRGIESDRDSGEDTTSIDDLPLDDSMIFPEYESFTFDDEPVMAEVNVFDEINTSELSYPDIGENVVSDEEEDTFTFTTRTFLPFVTYPEVLPVSYSTGVKNKILDRRIF
ncbi:hypothetical protein Tco_0840667 [Tanacetum coccineum]|uniref:Uncharacterized protein n=1 Tax=Tanacetum coccineum TaxID=301880 RepID=A0ABQ5AU93_9ASTR